MTKKEDQLAKAGEFLPTGYRLPDKQKQFMKIKPGSNLFRILSPPILGWVVFVDNGSGGSKPVRRHILEGDFSPADLKNLKAKKDESGKLEGSKHFWAFLVWSFQTNSPKVLEITQSTVLKPLKALIDNEEWGDPRNYNIDVIREGSGKNDSKFVVQPQPPKPLKEDILKVLQNLQEAATVNMEALLEGEYPFATYEFEN